MGLFGDVTSTATSTNLNQLCIDSITKSIASCTSSSTQNQLLQFSNIKGNIDINSSSLSQGATFDVSCILSSNKNAEISNNLSTVISQFAASKNASIPTINGTDTKTQSDLANKISNKLSNVTETQLSAVLAQNQSVIIDNVTGNIALKDVKMDQQASLIAKSLLTASDVSNIISDVQDSTNLSSASTTDNPIAKLVESVGPVVTQLGGALTQIFNSPGFVVFAVLALIVAGVGAYLYFGQRAKMASSMMPQGGIRSLGTSQFNDVGRYFKSSHFM